MVLGGDAGQLADEREVAGAALAFAPAASIHPPHDVGIEPDAGAERKAATVDATERDPDDLAAEIATVWQRGSGRAPR